METLDPDSQKKNYSEVGMLLYLSKYYRHDIDNSLRELSNCIKGMTYQFVGVPKLRKA